VDFDLAVIERNVRRLRNRLASAWDKGCSPAVVRRLENELRLWWRRREAARLARSNQNTSNPTPA
jgi:hypothetical protein